MSDRPDLRYLITPVGGLLLPAGQALIGGVGAAIIAGSLAYMAEAEKPLAWAGLIGGVVSLMAWYAGVDWWRDQISRAARPDPLAMGYHGETVRLEIAGGLETNYPWGDWLDLPIPPETLKLAFIALANGSDLSQASLAGRGHVLSRAEFCILRDALISAGLARWQNPRAHAQGSELSGAGRGMIRKYAQAALMAPQPSQVNPNGRRLTAGR